MRRKLLSHMLQGLESRAVYDYVASHKGVCALEHDGFFSYKEVTDWSLKWFTEFGHLNRGDMLTSEQHRCHNEKKKFQRRV